MMKVAKPGLDESHLGLEIDLYTILVEKSHVMSIYCILEAVFKYFCHFFGFARYLSYTPIVGSGNNSCFYFIDQFGMRYSLFVLVSF